MIVLLSRAEVAHHVSASLSSGVPRLIGSPSHDAADWLDKQGERVIVRRVGPSEYLVSPRVKR